MNSNKLLFRRLMNEAGAEGSAGGSGAAPAGGGATDGGVPGGGVGDGAGDGAASSAPEWVAGLPETVRDWDEVKNSDSPEKFWDQVTNMRSRIGRSITIPGEDASDEAKAEFRTKLREKVQGLVELPGEDDADGWNNLYSQLGRPEEAAGYAMPEVEGAPMSDDRASFLSEVAHEAGLSRGQFEKVMNKVLAQEAEVVQAQQAEFEQGMSNLKTEWGMAFDERSGVAEKVRSQFMKHVPAEAVGPETMKALYEIGKQLGGETAQVLNQGETGAALTPQDAQTQISEIRNNPQHPYNNKADPGHKAAREKVQRLYKAAYPGGGEDSGHFTAGIG